MVVLVVQENKRVKRIKTYQTLFSTHSGKEVLSDLMKAYYITSTTHSSDPLEMAYKEGQRSVVLSLIRLLKMDTNAMMKMIDEMEKDNV